MARDLDLARRVRAWAEPRGFIVIEVDGWETRGSADVNFVGSLDHHTAGPLRGDNPSLGVCINGRAGLAGPLCNIYISRSNIIYIVAAGRANHGGAGVWRGVSGNSRFYGVERENVGYNHIEPWREDQTECAAVVHAALGEGRFPAEMVCEHKEYATPLGRKIDAHTIDGNYMRAKVAYIMGHPVLEPAEGDWFDMRTDEEIKSLMRSVIQEQLHGKDVRFIISEGFASDPKARAWYIERGNFPVGPFDEAYCRQWAAERGINFDQSKEVLAEFQFSSWIDKFVRSQNQFTGPRGKDAVLYQPADRALTEAPGTQPR